MEFREAARRRRMVRRYTDEPVDPVVVEQLLDLARRAPSAGNTQGWRFLVLTDASARERFWAATTAPDAEPDRWLADMRTAPVLVVCFSAKDDYLERYAEPDKGWTDRDERHWPVPYWDVDTGMAALLLLLGAVDVGLGACFFGVPPERASALTAAFAVPDGLRTVGVVSLGHPAPDRRSPSLSRGRRPAAETVVYDSF